MKEDTIIALISSIGQSAVAVLRISGSQTNKVIQKHCRIVGKAYKSFAEHPRQMILCRFLGGPLPDKEETIDRGLAVYYPAPHSYTGEDSAELFLHGNPLLVRKITAAVISNDGVRIARPGEFTKRAYLNKKLDLSQAEAVNQIIRARSGWELSAAQRNLEGETRRWTSNLRSSLLHLKANLEAEVDFAVKEGESDIDSKIQREKSIVRMQSQIQDILERSKQSERLRSVFQIAIAGAPNAGKSSLFNRIIGWDRTIVSAQAGTTRDYVSEEIQLNGLTVRFVDTAGLRQAHNEIEKAGVRLAKKTFQRSQLILHVVDGERAPYTTNLEEAGLLDESGQSIPQLIVLNKWDKKSAAKHLAAWKDSDIWKEPVCLSCLTGEGLAGLHQKIYDAVVEKTDLERALLLEERHCYHLRELHKILERILTLCAEQAPEEIIALEMDRGLEEIGAVTSPVDNEEILGRIFSAFCIGK